MNLSIFCGHPGSFKISISKVQDFGNFELLPMYMWMVLDQAQTQQ